MQGFSRNISGGKLGLHKVEEGVTWKYSALELIITHLRGVGGQSHFQGSKLPPPPQKYPDVCRLADIIIISLLQDDGQQLEQETPQDVKVEDRKDAEYIVSTCT